MQDEISCPRAGGLFYIMIRIVRHAGQPNLGNESNDEYI